MKKSELKKLIREVISEQFSQGTYCEPGPNCVEPILTPISGAPEELALVCPTGFVFQRQETSDLMLLTGGQVLRKIPRCVPNIGSPGDMAGHGSTDDPFVPGMGFEDQFIDQITGPGGPFGGPAKSGGSGKGKPIRESKKRRK